MSLRSDVSFNRSWTEYRDGFGNFTENYWMGNEKLHLLTSSGNWKLRVEVQSNDSQLWYSAEFDHFQITDESSMYALDVTGYWGDAGNSFASTTYTNYYVVGMKFSTFDVDNDLQPNGSCASQGGAGWWFKCCAACLLCSRSARWEGLKVYGGSWTVSTSRMMIMST